MGLGWTGSILAQELTDAGLNVVAIERGPWRDTATDFNIGYMQDELRYAVRKDLFLQPALEAMTMRNNVDARRRCRCAITAPSCRATAWAAPACTGTASYWRFFPSDFQIKTHLTQRYGAKQDRGIAAARIGASPMTRSSIASTSSNISAAPRARPAI